MIVAKEPMQSIRARALKEGVYPLKWDGVKKAASGLATLEDVLNSLWPTGLGFGVERPGSGGRPGVRHHAL